MRARDFLVLETTLNRASLTSWPSYLQSLLKVPTVSIGNSGEIASNLVLDQATKKKINDLIIRSSSEDLASVVRDAKNTTISFEGPNSVLQQYKIKDIFKSMDIKGDQSVRLRGVFSEVLLGAAMYAKLIARGGDVVEKINNNDVWAVVEKIKPQGSDLFQTQVNDRGNRISDLIELSIRIPIDVQNVIRDPNIRPQYENIVSSWVNYVNDHLSQRYADRLYLNQRPDRVTVSLVGGSGKKVDVSINVLDANGQATSKREQVQVSVKLSNSLIGQHARGKNVQEVVNNLNKLFGKLGVGLSNPNRVMGLADQSGVKNQYIDGVVEGYQQVFDQLSELGKRDPALLVSGLSKLIEFYATRDDRDIQVVELDDLSSYKILGYRNLDQIFKSQGLVVDVEQRSYFNKSTGMNFPGLLFYGQTSQGRELLLVIRYRQRGNYAGHIVEPGSLLKKLAAYSRFKK